MSFNDLILFCIYSITESATRDEGGDEGKLRRRQTSSTGGRQEKCTFERLIKECFTNFPEAFSLAKYPHWPDSRKLDRPLRTLRKRKLILGDPKTEFSLTKVGKKIAIDITQTFKQKKLFK